MSSVDSMIRITAAVVVFMLWLFNILSGFWLVLLSICAVLSLITAFVNICPLYKILGLSTVKCERKVEEQQA